MGYRLAAFSGHRQGHLNIPASPGLGLFLPPVSGLSQPLPASPGPARRGWTGLSELPGPENFSWRPGPSGAPCLLRGRDRCLPLERLIPLTVGYLSPSRSGQHPKPAHRPAPGEADISYFPGVSFPGTLTATLGSHAQLTSVASGLQAGQAGSTLNADLPHPCGWERPGLRGWALGLPGQLETLPERCRPITESFMMKCTANCRGLRGDDCVCRCVCREIKRARAPKY